MADKRIKGVWKQQGGWEQHVEGSKPNQPEHTKQASAARAHNPVRFQIVGMLTCMCTDPAKETAAEADRKMALQIGIIRQNNTADLTRQSMTVRIIKNSPMHRQQLSQQSGVGSSAGKHACTLTSACSNKKINSIINNKALS